VARALGAGDCFEMDGPRRTALLASIVTLAVLAPPPPGTVAAGGGSGLTASVARGSSSGGAGLLGGGLAPKRRPPARIPPPPSRHARGHWLGGVTITEYWPAPESWFTGRLVTTPGLAGQHRIDWLYSATGVSMEGEGIGLDGRLYHIDSLGDGGWVTAAGLSTSPSDGWQAGSPFWRAGGYWRNRRRGVTFPLAAGGWSAGRGRHYVPLRHVSFAPGPSLPLHYYRSIAVDPGVIPLGSRVYVPAYRHDGYGGWFVAQDTGGAINGRHIDIYRSPPPSSTDSGRFLTSREIYVIRPHR
jgi:3D (Asp-Asp-Asp) domain-containing protein